MGLYSGIHTNNYPKFNVIKRFRRELLDDEEEFFKMKEITTVGRAQQFSPVQIFIR